MALANKESGRIHNKSGTDLTNMRNSYNAKKHIDVVFFAFQRGIQHS